MEVVAAFACSHAGFLVSHYDVARPEHRDAVYAGFERIREVLERTKPEALLVVATDHGRAYTLAHQPQFVIGVGPVARGLGDAGLPKYEVPVHQRFAQAILEGSIEEGVDLAFAEDVAIDHSFVTPLMLATPSFDLPIVPLVQNCRLPPMPSLKRSYEVGQKVGRAIRGGPSGRIAVLGTGGLSHWVGDERWQAFLSQPAGTRFGHEDEYPLVLGKTGPVNEEFDHAFLTLMQEGGARSFLKDWTNDRLVAEAGNGAQEIRNWLFVAGLVDDGPADVYAYAAVPEWLTGVAVAGFAVPK